jgi:RNA polymerase sigma-70 factor, ECF subfamily
VAVFVSLGVVSFRGCEDAVLDVEALYRKYGPMVLRRCRSLLGDEEKASDAMQDTFVRLLRRKESLTGEAPSSLLYCIATNVCLNLIRAERRRPVHPQPELIEQVAGSDDVEAMAQARQLIEGLFAQEESSTRLMAVLHYVDGFTLEETAARVGLSVSGLRKRLDRLRKRSRILMEDSE